MLHQKYNQLQPLEKVIFTGKLLHAVMNKEQFFDVAQAIIDTATIEGLFDNVEIMPERPKSDLFERLGEALKPETFNDINL